MLEKTIKWRGRTRNCEVRGYPYYVATAHSLDLDPSTGRVGPTATIVPPTGSMLQGDLVVVHCYYRGTGTSWTVSTTGGQQWDTAAKHTGTNNTVQVFYCQWNGSWDGSPIFSIGSGAETMIAVMSVWRSPDRSLRWGVDQLQLNSGAGTGFTIASVTPGSPNTVAIACVASSDDNTYGLSATTWGGLGLAQYRSAGGTDAAMALAYKTQGPPSDTGPLTLTQTALGADAGITLVVVFKSGPDFGIGAVSARPRAPFQATPGRLRKGSLAITSYFPDTGPVLPGTYWRIHLLFAGAGVPPIVSAASQITLAADAAGLASAAAALAKGDTLAAAAAGLASAAAALAKGDNLAAAAAGLASASVALAKGDTLAAAAAGLASAAAALAKGDNLAAAAAGLASASAALTTTAGLSAAASSLSTASAAITTQIQLAATGSGVSTAAASMIVGAAFAAAATGLSTATAGFSRGDRLAAAAAAVASAGAALARGDNLAAASAALGSAAANLQTNLNLAASAVAIATASATLNTAGNFAAAASAIATAAAALNAQISMTTAGSGVATASASLKVGAGFAAGAIAQALAGAALSAGAKLASGAVASAQATAVLGNPMLPVAASGLASAVAFLMAEIRFAAQASATATSSATLGTPGALLGAAASASASATAALNGTAAQLAAAAHGLANAFGALTAAGPAGPSLNLVRVQMTEPKPRLRLVSPISARRTADAAPRLRVAERLAA